MFSLSTATDRRDGRTAMVLAAGLLASAAMHAAVLTWAALRGPAVMFTTAPVELQLIPIEATSSPPRPAPAELPKAAPVRQPVKLAGPKRAAALPPAPVSDEPAKPSPEPLVIPGILRSAVALGGSVHVPVGNSPNAPLSDSAATSGQAQTPSNFVPAGNVDREPVLTQDFKAPYPDEARRAGAFGTVRLRVLVNELGQVVAVEVLSGPGFGLNEAAREALKNFLFRPALKAGQPVSTTIVHKYTFALD